MTAEDVLVCIALCCTFCFIRQRVQNKQVTTLLKTLWYHTGINTTVMGFNMLLIIYSIYRYHKHPSKSLSDGVHGFGGVVFPLIYFVPIMFQLFLSIWLAGGCNHCCTASHRRHYMDMDRSENATNPTSHPINQPSHTYFSVPYTGAFTQETSSGHFETKKGEERPLINC